MLPPRWCTARLLVAALVATAGACSDQTPPTAVSVVPNAAAGPGPNANTKVKVKQFQLSSNTLRLDGPSVTAQVIVGNSGAAYVDGVSLRAEIVQGTTTRVAADLPTACPGQPGQLPGGTCEMTFPVTATRSGPGGTLVPGAAIIMVRVILTSGGVASELANKSLDVNLVATPTITVTPLDLVTIAGPPVAYTATLQNPANSLQGVAIQGWIRQDNVRLPAGGAQVTCGSSVGVLPPGTCTMSFAAVADGALSPGAATFELELKQGSTILDMASVPIELVKPTITSVVLSTTSIVLDGASVDYTVQIDNRGVALSDVLLQGSLEQDQLGGTVTAGAGGTYVTCGGAVGALPTGLCTMQFTVTASTVGNANGTLMPGPARFLLQLFKAPVNVAPYKWDATSVGVTLTSPTPTIASLVPASSYVVLDQANASTSYTATIDNPGPARSIVLLQGWVRQGTARRAAGGSQVNCGSVTGTLPTGSCTEQGVIVANNGPSQGSGTLVPGPATFELELKQNDGTTETILDTKTIPITLVANTPSIASISLESTTIAIGGSTHFTATVYNPTGASIPNAGLQGYVEQNGGATSHPAGGVGIHCVLQVCDMPAGVSVVTFTINPKNTSVGTGTLVAGPATFRLQLYTSTPSFTVLDEKTVAITLTTP